MTKCTTVLFTKCLCG